MKKLFIVLFILLFVTPVSALVVGDKMPYIEDSPDFISPWIGPLTGASGERRFKDNENGVGFKMEAYLRCNNIMLLVPFGVFDSIDELVYLDYDMDGKIDQVIFPGKSIATTAPACP